nr:immunoglobulin heavy chain junction region [Macaca mulatta]MOX39166.1 immunoglobulin heavy chain junction region [Macaca mulatta]MOX40085.1 immunoglobulin heavy chain junction region [Macaca mulatta]MOX40531.1 immunoglobulin heavy chain junction region [Macaca mulatta]
CARALSGAWHWDYFDYW